MKKLLGFVLMSWIFAPEISAYPIIKGEGPQLGKEFHTGLVNIKGNQPVEDRTYMELDGCDSLPDAYDLRDIGTVPPIKDQGQCGSCWAFSKTGSFESALLASGKYYTAFSEQELVSCDRTQFGCQGGYLHSEEYQITHGQGLDKDLPYKSGVTQRSGICKLIPMAEKAIKFVYVGAAGRYPTETELKCALYKTHTVPWIVVSATGAWGSPPASYKTPYTRCGRGQTNHAVGVVGWYKDPKGKTQFIMKNSWGESWGDKGYMSLALGCDSFGEEVAFISLDATP